ncbi:unnamed protein product [Durusdinium trenchii]|uniref:cGMP-dependent protein kinase n=1 Tax=Durusdinium trenchii TaxID=1381693 RepID=A0ABP0KM99_9DINO
MVSHGKRHGSEISEFLADVLTAWDIPSLEAGCFSDSLKRDVDIVLSQIASSTEARQEGVLKVLQTLVGRRLLICPEASPIPIYKYHEHDLVPVAEKVPAPYEVHFVSIELVGSQGQMTQVPDSDLDAAAVLELVGSGNIADIKEEFFQHGHEELRKALMAWLQETPNVQVHSEHKLIDKSRVACTIAGMEVDVLLALAPQHLSADDVRMLKPGVWVKSYSLNLQKTRWVATQEPIVRDATRLLKLWARTVFDAEANEDEEELVKINTYALTLLLAALHRSCLGVSALELCTRVWRVLSSLRFDLLAVVSLMQTSLPGSHVYMVLACALIMGGLFGLIFGVMDVEAVGTGQLDSFPQPTFFQSHTQHRLEFLSKVKLFQRLPEDQHNLLASACEEITYEDGEVIIRQGDQGHEFFIIKDGEAEVFISQKKQATLKVGDHFGENALLRDEPRTATIKAAGRLKALKITRAQFVELGLREKLDFPQRKAVGGMVHNIEVKEPTPKTESDRILISNALKANENLQSVVDLDIPRIKAICDIAWREDVAKDTKLISEGDLNADYFYIVQSGSFNVFMGDTSMAEGKAAKPVTSIGPGGSFGELALLYFAPRAATVQAADDSKVWVIDRGNFKKIMAKSSDEREAEYLKYLEKVDILSPLKKEEKAALAKCLTEFTFVKGDIIFQQGDTGDAFYLLVDGTVELLKDDKAFQRQQGVPDKAKWFGERALLKNEPRAATVKVVSTSVRTLMVDKQSFDMLLGPLEELKKRGKSGPGSKLQDGKNDATELDLSRFGKIKRKDLKVLGLLGCGGFGAVELVEHQTTNETYALKALSKGFLVKSGMQQSVMSEKNVQLMCDSTFIVKVFETFNSDTQLFFLLELALGGELYATYHKKGLFGKEGQRTSA